LVGVALSAAFAAQAQAQNLVVNGSFESVANDAGKLMPGTDNYLIKSATETAAFSLTGWTNASWVGVVYGSGLGDLAANSPLYNQNDLTKRKDNWVLRGQSAYPSSPNPSYVVPASSPDGGNFFGSDANYYQGTLTQTVNGLVVGQSYTLSFWSAGGTLLTGGGGGYNDASWTATVTNGSKTDLNVKASTGQYSAVAGTSPWLQTVVTFTASATSELLTFTPSGGGSPPMALLDGVSIVAVPEPAQWAMLGGGLLLIGARLRRRRMTS
jgi:hypothetical protein